MTEAAVASATAPGTADGRGPLAGVRVIELGMLLAGPFTGRLLGDMGAEVIKVEPPGKPDPLRDWGQARYNGRSLWWPVQSRNKKCVTLNLRAAKGQELLLELVKRSDVVTENFRPGTLEKWHVGPADLDTKLVVVRISSFGQDGPYAARPGLDRVGIGYGGLLNLTGYPDRPPVRVGVTISDYLTGVFAAQAAVSALYARDARRRGGGAVIDAALYGAPLRILEWTVPAYDRLGIVRQREGNRLANSAPLDNYPTADGKFVCIVAGSDANFTRLCKAMDRTDLLHDPRFAKLADRAEHGDLINGIVAEWTSAHAAAEIEDACVACDVPVATAYTAADMFADPQFAARGDLLEVDDPVVGPLRQQAPFPRVVGEPVTAPTGAPRLGEHTRDVLRELGLSDTELDGLAEDGVI
jgi:crotonobetainyl-CoA:carnitine CoA-transferase CaiB-like acyl-CoA transferase